MKLLNKRWVNRSEKNKINELVGEKTGVSPLVAKVLSNRKIKEVAEAMDFLYAKTNKLLDPFLLEDMRVAVDRINEAIEKGERICIFGDFDVDGVTSTSVMMLYLTSFYSNVHFYIPMRSEGYGLNKVSMKKIKDEGTDLMISVDCGISALEEAEYAKEIGLDLIITDHHEAGGVIPNALAVVNPKRKDNSYPFDSLAGCGVAYKLCVALQSHKHSEKYSDDLKELLDIVALGTVADLMPLTGENRIMVREGLARMNSVNTQRIGMRELIAVCSLSDKKITAGHIGFQLAPRINALGRLDNVMPAVTMFLTEDVAESEAIARLLNEKNVERQEIQERMTKSALSMLPQPADYKKKTIILAGENWNSGIKGIVASKILEEYYRPTILFVKKEDRYEGSARSIEDFNIKEALDKCSDLLLRYGGHHGAAGMTVMEDKFEAFIDRFEEVTSDMTVEEDFIPKVRYDDNVLLNNITFQTVEELSQLEPFGQGNASPTFAFKDIQVLNVQTMGGEKQHLRFDILQQGHRMKVIAFGKGHLENKIKDAENKIELIGALGINDFNNQKTIQIEMKDIRIEEPFVSEEDQFVRELFQKADSTLGSGIANADSFVTKVVGVSFEGRQNSIKGLKTGDELFFERQPTNPHDANAIAIVDSIGTQYGYIMKKHAKELAPILDSGVEYTIEVININGLEVDGNHTGINIIVEKKQEGQVSSFEQLQLTKRANSLLKPQELFSKIKEQLLGGYDLRPKQIEAINYLMAGYNTLSILGTGRGKSAIFQSIAAYKALEDGKTTIIVYPLRALANDQLASMQRKFAPLGLQVIKGTGEVRKDDREKLWGDLKNGTIDILLTTPEFLVKNKEVFVENQNRIGFVVVDEGHHIGNSTLSYRPAYKEFKSLLNELGNPLTAVMTATASDENVSSLKDIVPLDKIVIDATVRSNLMIVDKREIKGKEQYLAEIVSYGEKTIIYANSREKTIEISKKLRSMVPQLRDKIGYYNAGLSTEDRYMVEKLFREGHIRTIVSTSAFGEGIDIPDIRHVMHYHMTFNDVEFNQESGRAGRDGEKAYIHLLFGSQDLKVNEFIIKKEVPSEDFLKNLFIYLLQVTEKGTQDAALDVRFLAGQMAAHHPEEIIVDDTVMKGLAIFKELDFLEFSESSGLQYIRLNQDRVKKAISDSILYQEGVSELEEFEDFSKKALNLDSLALLKTINKPIYPTKINQ